MVLVRYSNNLGFGIAVSGTREGNVIALISGVSMPMILRKDVNAFRVSGPAFLPGMMDREVWKRLTTASAGSGDLMKIILI